MNDDGAIIHLNETCARTIDKLVEKATAKALHWQIVDASGKLEFEHGIYLRSTVVGAQWPQARKHKAGIVSDPR